MVTRQEVEEGIRGKDEFVKISYLNRFLREADSMDMKKFILLNLASVNETKGFLNDAIKNVAGAGDISITFKDKRELYMKEVELWIKIMDFNMAERAFNKVLGYCNEKERKEVQEHYENLFEAIGRSLENKGKHRLAIDVYKKLIENTKSVPKRMETKERLVKLYDLTGRIREADRTKRMNV